jgi:hypothetical protein
MTVETRFVVQGEICFFCSDENEHMFQSVYLKKINTKTHFSLTLDNKVIYWILMEIMVMTSIMPLRNFG